MDHRPEILKQENKENLPADHAGTGTSSDHKNLATDSDQKPTKQKSNGMALDESQHAKEPAENDSKQNPPKELSDGILKYNNEERGKGNLIDHGIDDDSKGNKKKDSTDDNKKEAIEGDKPKEQASSEAMDVSPVKIEDIKPTPEEQPSGSNREENRSDADNDDPKEDKENKYLGSKPGAQWPAGKIIHAIRPNQDVLQDEEMYSMKCYTPETTKKGMVNQAPGQVIDAASINGPSGRIVFAGANKVMNGDQSHAQLEDEEEEEEEEEEGVEVIVPSLKNKRRLQIFNRPDETIGLEPLRELKPNERSIHAETAPFLYGFMKEFEKRTTQNKTEFSKTLDMPAGSSAVEAGQKLAVVSADRTEQYKPLAASLTDDFFSEIRSIGGNSTPVLKNLMLAFKKTTQNVFRDGFTWSRLMTQLVVTFEIFVRLCQKHTNETARGFVTHVPTVFANVGLISWITEKGGWAKAADKVAEENPRRAWLSRGQKKEGKGCAFACLASKTSAKILGAAGALAAAGAAYYLFRR